MGAPAAMAIEEAAFNLIEKNKPFEIRDYAPYILAEVVVEEVAVSETTATEVVAEVPTEAATAEVVSEAAAEDKPAE